MATTNPAPAASAVRSQATARWPNRNQASDGVIPSAAHTAASPNSDHEIGAAGYNHAVDLTHDSASGCDCRKIAEEMRLAKDSRIKYVIYNRRIFASYSRTYRKPWEWGPYSGSNPHTRHMHVSILDTRAACLDTSAWPGIVKEEAEVTMPDPETESERKFDTLMLHYDPYGPDAEEIRSEFLRFGAEYGKATGRQIARIDDWHYWEPIKNVWTKDQERILHD